MLAQDQGLAILPWSPLAGGLLSGKFDENKKGPEWARGASFDFPPVDHGRLPRVLAALRDVATEADLSVARVALAWVLTRPFVSSVIIGAKTKEQLKDNLAASDASSRASSSRSSTKPALPVLSPNIRWMVDWQNNRDPRVPPARNSPAKARRRPTKPRALHGRRARDSFQSHPAALRHT